MKTDDHDRLHEALDNSSGTAEGVAPGILSRYRNAMSQLSPLRIQAPAGFMDRVMAALPERPDRTWREGLASLWPHNGQWAVPALAGALTAFLILLAGAWLFWTPTANRDAPLVARFELHAPGAHRVELLGSFNKWTPGSIVLKGPDATGHWTADVRLSPGRYEYQFLVDSRQWMTDPTAVMQRPDGFGRKNAVIDIDHESREGG